eukprot:s2248_g1.t1
MAQHEFALTQYSLERQAAQIQTLERARTNKTVLLMDLPPIYSKKVHLLLYVIMNVERLESWDTVAAVHNHMVTSHTSVVRVELITEMQAMTFRDSMRQGRRYWRTGDGNDDAGKNLAVMADLGKVSRDATLDLEAAVEHLFKVAKEAGCFVSPKIKRGCAPPLYIPGLLAAEDIQEGEELLRIPAHLHLTPPAVEAAAPALAAVAKKSAMPDHRRSEALHSFFLARLLADSQERALDKAAEGKSILRSYWTASEAQQKVWEAYADTLLGEDFAYHPFRLAAFNPGGTREAMRPSQEAEYFIEMATDLMMLHESMVRCGQEAGVPDSVEAEMFLRARLCSQTRVFQTCVDTTLVPVADLLNHSPTLTPGVLWAWDGEAQCMVITAVRAHRSGEELFTTYGSRSNMLLYRTYGFTLHPKEEPSFTYIIRPHIVRPVMKVFWGHEEAKPLMLLESSHIDDSLCKARLPVYRYEDWAQDLGQMGWP